MLRTSGAGLPRGRRAGANSVNGGSSEWTLAHVWEALRKFWLLIVGFAIIFGAAGFAISSASQPQFQARASLYFTLTQGTSGTDLNQGSAYTQNQMLSFARLATSSRVLEPVIEELGVQLTPRELARSITIAIPQDTVVLDVTAGSIDPDRAAATANAVANELASVVREVAAESTEGAPNISASLIDDAVPPTTQTSPNKSRDAVLAAAIGFLLGVLAAFIATIADTRVRNEAAVARVTNLPVLGSVMRTRRGSPASLIIAREPHSPAAESMRRIHSALAYSSLDTASRKLLIASASPSEGKSTFATNLAVTLADAGERTIVIDADLRRPRVGEIFGHDNSVGLTTALLGDVELDEAVVAWGKRGPDVLSSGAVPPNPAAILTSRAFRSMLEQISERYEAVVIDSPPVLSVADSNLLAPMVDGIVIVVDASKTRRAQLANAVRSIESAGGQILGIVLNKVKAPRHRESYYVQTPQKRRRGGRSGTRDTPAPADA